MIRAIRPNAMAQDDAALVTGWNVAPNLGYVLRLLPSSVSCGVLLYADDETTLIASGAALVGDGQPCILIPQTGQAVEMVDADLGWHLLLTTTGAESQRTIRLGPAVDLPDEIHPVYGEDDLALVRATAAINAAAHYIDDVTVTCPLGPGAVLGDVVSVPVDGVATVGQVESITWTATPDGTTETAVIRRHVAIAPEVFVEPAPHPFVADDAAETDAATPVNGNVLANDDTGLAVVAVAGLSINVGTAVDGDNGGTFVINADGSWTFDPDGGFNGLTGEDTATTRVIYHASDGTAEAMATLTVTVSSGAALPWTPAEITTALWLDASDTDTATIVDGKISQRADKSGNNRHATQSTAGYRPVAATNKDDFDGTDDRMIVAHDSVLAAPAYIAVVAKANVTAQYKGLLDKWNNSAGWMVEFGPTATQGKPRITVNSTALVAPTTVHNVLSVVECQISGAASFIGTPAGVTSGTLPAPTSVTQDLAIAGDGVSTLCTDLEFHEMVVLSSAPDSTTRAKIQGYLSHKWDSLLGVTTLVSALPSDHPYKSTPPTI